MYIYVYRANHTPLCRCEMVARYTNEVWRGGVKRTRLAVRGVPKGALRTHSA